MTACKDPECTADDPCSRCCHLDEIGSELRMEIHKERYGGE